MYRSSPSVPTGQKSLVWQPLIKKEPCPEDEQISVALEGNSYV